METTSELSNLSLRGSGPSQYVKLNVGGSLHYTTIATLTKHDNMLRAMFSGRMEVLTDADGWILIGRNDLSPIILCVHKKVDSLISITLQ